MLKLLFCVAAARIAQRKEEIARLEYFSVLRNHPAVASSFQSKYNRVLDSWCEAANSAEAVFSRLVYGISKED